MVEKEQYLIDRKDKSIREKVRFRQKEMKRNQQRRYMSSQVVDRHLPFQLVTEEKRNS